MPNASHSLMHYLRTIAGAWRDDTRDDAELLTCFADNHDEDAFRALAWRHGSMVWQTCRRILGGTPDAEDAFQTVFLTLTRNARRLRREPLAGWLHQVARRAALNVEASVRRRRNLERQVQTTKPPEAKEDRVQAEQSKVLDEELAGLPEKSRIALILHFLEGKTQAEVARILGCTQSSVQRRLVRGETILRKRLEERGLPLGAVSIASLLGNAAETPAMPADLIASTARAAVAFNGGKLTGVSADAAQKLLRAMQVQGAMRLSGWLTLLSVFALGSGATIWKVVGDRSNPSKPPEPPVASSSHPAAILKSRVDAFGDTLPEGALARIGSVRFRSPGLSFPEHKEGEPLSRIIALSTDGKTLASVHNISTWSSADEHKVAIRFWNSSSGKELRETILHDTDESQITFSPDGALLAATKPSASKASRLIELLDVATGRPSGDPFPGNWPVAFTPDSKSVICTTNHGFSLYDVVTRKPIRDLFTTFAASFVVFSRDGRSLVSIDDKGAVHLLDFQTGNELAKLNRQDIVTVAFTPDGNVITGGKDKTIRIWDVKNGGKLTQLGTMAEVPTVTGCTPDSKTLLAACPGQIRSWEATSGKEYRPDVTAKGLIRPLILSADGKRLIEEVSNVLRIWDVETGRETGPAAEASRSVMDRVVFSPNGKLLATTGSTDALGDSKALEIQLWDSISGKSLGSLPVPIHDEKQTVIVDLTWRSNDTLMATVVNESGVRILRWLRVSSKNQGIEPEEYVGGVKFLSDSKVLARLRSNNMEFVEISTNNKLFNIPLHLGLPIPAHLVFGSPFAFSSDHRFLATNAEPNGTEITLWELSTGRKLYSFNKFLPPRPLPSEELPYQELIGFSPDDRLIATRDRLQTRTIKLWEHVTGQLRMHLSMPSDFNHADSNVAFSPDGRLIATGCMTGPNEERSIHIWDLVTGKECQCIQGYHPWGGFAGAPKVMFSPDGRRIASAGMDCTVLIWPVKQPPAIPELDKPLKRDELQAFKTALTDFDAKSAYRAICKLRQSPEQAVPLMAECLIPRKSSLEEKDILQMVNHLITDLDSDNFQIRMKASKELGQMLSAEEGEPIIQNAMCQALTKKTSVEVSTAIKHLLDEVKEERRWRGANSPELTRMFRAIEVLERIGNDPARTLLQKVVDSSSRPEVQLEAEAALKRLKNSEPQLNTNEYR